MAAANKETTVPRVPSDKVEVMTWLAVTEYLCHK
jgi:hypothetical protein